MEEVEYIDVYDIHHEPTGLVAPQTEFAEIRCRNCL